MKRFTRHRGKLIKVTKVIPSLVRDIPSCLKKNQVLIKSLGLLTRLYVITLKFLHIDAQYHFHFITTTPLLLLKGIMVKTVFKRMHQLLKNSLKVF